MTCRRVDVWIKADMVGYNVEQLVQDWSTSQCQVPACLISVLVMYITPNSNNNVRQPGASGGAGQGGGAARIKAKTVRGARDGDPPHLDG